MLLSEDLLAAIQYRSHHRLALVERLPHPDPLAALAGVSERHPGGGARPSHLVIGGNQRFELAAQRLGIGEHHPGPMGKFAAPHPGRPGHVGEQFAPRRASFVGLIV